MNETATFERDKAIDQVATPTRNLYDECLRFAQYYVTITLGTFTSEDIIYLHQVTHKQLPAEKRVWGAVIRKLHQDGKIKHAGFCTYRNPAGHAKPSRMWISVTL